MTRWYRAYEGTVTDAKLGEVALVAGCSRSVAIASWHCILESAASANCGGGFDVTPRRVAVILGEQPALIEAVFSELAALGMICDGKVTAWGKRQYESDNSTERSRKSRERAKTDAQQECNGDATLQQQHATPPETETETEEVISLSETSSDQGPKRKRGAYPDPFETFWSAYPTDPNMAKSEAFKAWKKLDADDQSKAIAAVKPFKDWVSKQRDYRTLHACRFLSQRRFDGFAGTGQQAGFVAPAPKIIREGTPEWLAYLATHPRAVPRDLRTEAGIVRGAYLYEGVA